MRSIYRSDPRPKSLSHFNIPCARSNYSDVVPLRGMRRFLCAMQIRWLTCTNRICSCYSEPTVSCTESVELIAAWNGLSLRNNIPSINKSFPHPISNKSHLSFFPVLRPLKFSSIFAVPVRSGSVSGGQGGIPVPDAVISEISQTL